VSVVNDIVSKGGRSEVCLSLILSCRMAVKRHISPHRAI
jgi:hypothetical protein